jgi:hypothetical protein
MLRRLRQAILSLQYIESKQAVLRRWNNPKDLHRPSLRTHFRSAHETGNEPNFRLNPCRVILHRDHISYFFVIWLLWGAIKLNAISHVILTLCHVISIFFPEVMTRIKLQRIIFHRTRSNFKIAFSWLWLLIGRLWLVDQSKQFVTMTFETNQIKWRCYL